MPDANTYRYLTNHRNSLRNEAKCPTPTAKLARIEAVRQAALDNPDLWGIHTALCERFLRNAQRASRRPEVKPPLINPLELGQSGLERVLRGSDAPVWAADPERMSGDPETSE